MHRLSTAVPQSSTLTVLCCLGLLGVQRKKGTVYSVPFSKWRNDNMFHGSAVWRVQKRGTEKTVPSFLTAVLQSSTLTALYCLGLLGVLHEYACGALPRTPCHRGAFGTSSRKSIHNPGWRASPFRRSAVCGLLSVVNWSGVQLVRLPSSCTIR